MVPGSSITISRSTGSRSSSGTLKTAGFCDCGVKSDVSSQSSSENQYMSSFSLDLREPKTQVPKIRKAEQESTKSQTENGEKDKPLARSSWLSLACAVCKK